MKKYLFMFFMLIGTSIGAFAQQEMEITGTVTDAATGEPLIGVSVTVKNVPGLGVATDIDGNYTIKVKEFQTLVFSYIGYENVEQVIKSGRTRVDIALKEEKLNAVDEVVVTAMGTQKKLTVTGAVTNVEMGDLKHYSSSNFSNTLAGNVPGIIAYQSSGQPGKNTSEFWIRGISTFGAGDKAYILVDGFERENIDDLNIEDIESFSVLKDASATAIYGSKGANGVILITTKHGKAGKVNINAKFETAYNTRTITPEFVSGYDYAKLINEARVTRNIGVLYQPVELELIRSGLDPDLYPNVDWKDLLLKDGAFSYRANVNLSGGGETARYFASISYTEDQGMYKTDDTLKNKYDTNANYKRWNYRLNVDVDLTPTTLVKFGVSGNLNKRNSPGFGDDGVWGQLFGYNALYSPILYSNGYIPFRGVTNPEEYGGTNPDIEAFVRDYGNYMNPWVSTTQTGYNQNWDNNVQLNATLEQKLDFITKGLRVDARFGFDTYNSNWINRRRIPSMYAVEKRSTEDGSIEYKKVINASDMKQTSGGSGSRREFLDILLHWDRTFAKAHTLGVNVKYTWDKNTTTVNIGNDIRNGVSHVNMGLAAQATYNFKNRYFLDYNFGYNGTENFADHHRFGFFPAWSVAWNIGEEPWVKDHIKWIDMFKIRYSHGKVGNDNTGIRFPYLYTIGSTGVDRYNFGQVGSTGGLSYSLVASDNVTWEVARKDDLGVDLYILGNKFNLTADYFYEKRTGIFTERHFLPETIGIISGYPRANVGAVRQRGIDGNFKYEDNIGQVRFTIRGNMTYSKNEILEYDEENNVYPYLNQHGYRVNQARGLVALGMFKDYDDIRNSPRQEFGTYQPGDIKYKDVNGDGVVNNNDIVAIGATSTPNLIYGLGLSIYWKGFDFNLHFQGAGKATAPILGKCVYAFSEGQWGNIFKGMLDDRWVSADISGNPATENPNASYPRLSYGGSSNNFRNSTFWLRDGRYLRLKNLDFGYTLPKVLVNKLHLGNVRIYVQGTNLFFISKKFDTWDPESLPTNPRGEAYPITKSITAGLQVSL